MGSFGANISRNMHDFRNRYLQWLYQKGVPVVDADLNDGIDSVVDYMRWLILGIAGNGSPNNGFRVVGTGATNDFTIQGGDGTFEGAGLLYVDGLIAFLTSDITYRGTPAAGLAGEDQRSIFPRITGVTFDAVANETVITDSAANYVTNELVGRNITPDIESPANVFAIASNTANTIRVSGDITASAIVGKRYRLELSTPSANRIDGVFVNLYLDEVDSTEDPNLLHSFTVPSPTQIEAARRKRVEATIFVREDTTTHGNFTSYTDSDGNKHFVLKIATISRAGADPTITSSMVSDLRRLLTPGGISAPVGTIIAYGGSTAPTGWLLADGSTKLISDYTDLFNVFGTTYGGDGVTTFGLPDLRGRVPAGLDSADADFNLLGKTLGTKDNSHVHNISLTTSSDGAHNHGGSTDVEFQIPGPTWAATFASDNLQHKHNISTDGAHTHTVSGNSASAGATNGNIQPSIVVNYIIKF